MFSRRSSSLGLLVALVISAQLQCLALCTLWECEEPAEPVETTMGDHHREPCHSEEAPTEPNEDEPACNADPLSGRVLPEKAISIDPVQVALGLPATEWRADASRPLPPPEDSAPPSAIRSTLAATVLTI